MFSFFLSFFHQASTRFDGYLTAKIAWSKNIRDETNSPVQLLLADMDPRSCVYLSLALWLEKWLAYGDGVTSQWLFCKGSTTETSPYPDQQKEANRGKITYSRALKRALESPSFERADGNRPGAKLGSHSIRKKAATMAREKGCPKDDLDY